MVIGPDLLARGGRLVTERTGSEDKDLTKSPVTHEQFDRLIRNTYKVLLTRGLAGWSCTRRIPRPRSSSPDSPTVPAADTTVLGAELLGGERTARPLSKILSGNVVRHAPER
ncbi:DNA/RNA helicase domain-containing protein [Streptosporangium sp. NPDC049078]|uniref:DNA/RNA helicase domain-containing protein n=1 Tax=Streptosporangium sp. NPDC049078 TaxID=3155767 RepID=UPI003424EE2B